MVNKRATTFYSSATILSSGIVPEHSFSPRKLAPLDRPNVLTADYYSVRWTFSHTRLAHLQAIRWDRKFEDGTRLSDAINADLLETCRRYLTVILNKADALFAFVDFGTAIQRARELLRIVGKVVSLGFRSFSDMNRADLKRLKKMLPRRSKANRRASGPHLSSSAINQSVTVLDDLWRLFNFPQEDGLFLIGDGPRFAAFTVFSEGAVFAKNRGNPKGKPKILSSDFVFRLLSVAAAYVYLYADDLIELQRRTLEGRTVSAPTREPNGSQSRSVALVLLRMLNRVPPGSVHDGRISRRYLSTQIGVHVTSLYKPRFHLLLSEWERLYAGEFSADESRAFRQKLEALTALGTSYAPRPPHIPRYSPFTGRDGPGSPWPIARFGASAGANSLQAALNDLWTSIYLILGAFCGGRIEELLSLPIGCISDSPAGLYLRKPVFKGKGDKAKTTRQIPTVEIVQRAIHVATELGKVHRDWAGSSSLFFEASGNSRGVPHYSTVRKRLLAFGAKFAPEEHIGEDWIHPHELRNFLAAAWINYYDYGVKFPELQKLLDHEQITTTVIYGARGIQGENISSKQREKIVDMFVDELTGVRDMQGLFADTLRFVHSRLRLTVTDDEEIIGRMSEFLDQRGSQVYPLPFGFCVWSAVGSHRAQCRKPGAVTNSGWPLGRKLCKECGRCANFLTNEFFAPFWTATYESNQMLAANENAPAMLRDAAVEGAKIARLYLSQA